uniref:Uncharacterized protein n=1 Tax=Plectus sambesii TaxID=2011161 RepID=A0A914W6B8_9BILA
MFVKRIVALLLLALLARASFDFEKNDNEESIEDENVQSEWLSLPDDDAELAVTETAPQCGNEDDLFPESGLEDMPEDTETLICEREELCPTCPKPKPHCKMCCKIGAMFGKAVKKGKCPFIQCRNFYLTFYKQHKKCIKKPKVCGFFFVKCCVRQHHKDIYAPQEEYDQNQIEN